MGEGHKHDDECLNKTVVDSIGYELRMMGAMARPLTDGRPESALAGNALLEAYLTHVRCLHEFLAFAPPRQHPHTVRAVNYFTTRRDPFPCLDPGVYESICQKLSHVTCARVPGYSWSGPTGDDVSHLAVTVFDTMNHFLDALDTAGHNDRRSWFEKDLAQAHVDFAHALAGAFVFGRTTT